MPSVVIDSLYFIDTGLLNIYEGLPLKITMGVASSSFRLIRKAGELVRTSFLLRVKKFLFICLLVLSFFPNPALAVQATIDRSLTHQKMKSIRLPFIENQGQLPSRKIKFYTDTLSGRVAINWQGGIQYSLPVVKDRKIVGIQTLMEAPDGNPALFVQGREITSTQINYIIGKDSKGFKKNIPAFNQLDFGHICDGITLRLQAKAYTIEKLFCVAPYADPSDISIRISGGNSAVITPGGELLVQTDAGPVRFTKPMAFQKTPKGMQAVDAAYLLTSIGNEIRYGFQLGIYDPSRELIIDPLLAGTCFGGSEYDSGYDMAVNSFGDVYICGKTYSADLPVTGTEFQDHLVPGDDSYIVDAFIAKFNYDLTTLRACTYFGGSNPDEARAITIDSNERVWITGTTESVQDFPTTEGALEESSPENDEESDAVFVARFNSGDLSYLEASTLILSKDKGYDQVLDIVVDSNNKPYIVGYTHSDYLPTTPGAFQETAYQGYGSCDGFIVKLEWDLKSIMAATYLNGADSDFVRAIDVTQDGVYVAGGTFSNDFITCSTGPGGTFHGEEDGFVARFNTDLTWLIASRFLGGTLRDDIDDLAVKNGTVYLVGVTSSENFPVTEGSFKTVHPAPGYNALFITSLSGTGLTLKNSTFLGVAQKLKADRYKSDSGKMNVIHPDESGTIFVAGHTEDQSFPLTTNAYQTSIKSSGDVFVSRMDNTLHTLLGSTGLAGDASFDESLIGLVQNSQGDIYVMCGATNDTDFAFNETAYQPQLAGESDLVIVKLNPELSASVLALEADISMSWIDFGLVSPGEVSDLKTVTLSNTGEGDLVIQKIDFEEQTSEFELVNDLCANTTLLPGQYCSFAVKFMPQSTGIKNAALTITSNTDPISLPLRGEGKELGDLNRDTKVDLADLILSLKPLTAKPITSQTASEDFTGDGRIGMAEAIFIAGKIARNYLSDEDKEQIREKVDTGMTLIANRDYASAKTNFEDALAVDPDDPEANAGFSLAVLGENREMRTQTLRVLFSSLADNDLSFSYSIMTQLMQGLDDLPFISLSRNRTTASDTRSPAGIREPQSIDFDLQVPNGLKEIVLRVTNEVPLMDSNYFSTMTTLKSLLNDYTGLLEFILPYIRKAQTMTDLQLEVPLETFKDMFNYDLDGDGANDFFIPGDKVCIDQGDFYLIDVVISLVLGLGRVFDAYSFEGATFEVAGDINHDGYIVPDEYLPPEPYYTLSTGSTEKLFRAKQHLMNVVYKLDTGLTITLNEPIDYYELLPVNSDPEFRSWLQSMQQSNTCIDLVDLKALINGVYTVDLSKQPFYLSEQVIRANPMIFFDNPRDLRDYLPAIKISDSTMVYLNDPSLGGNIPDENLSDILNLALDHATLDHIPIIDSLSPETPDKGASITVSGQGFGDTMDESQITIAGRMVSTDKVASWSDTQIQFELESNMISGKLVVTVDDIRSNSKRLTISGMSVDNFDDVSYAQPAGTPPTTIDSGLWVYDIYDIDSPSGATSSDWKISDGFLKEGSDIYKTGGSTDPNTNLARGTNLILKDQTISDGTLVVGFGVDSGSLTGTDNDGIGVIFRYQDEDNFYRLMSVRDDFWDKGPWIRLEKWVDGTMTILAISTNPDDVYKSAADDDMHTGDINEFQVETSGSRIKVFLRQYKNGTWGESRQVFDITDAQFSSGRVGVSTYSMWWALIDYIGIQK